LCLRRECSDFLVRPDLEKNRFCFCFQRFSIDLGWRYPPCSFIFSRARTFNEPLHKSIKSSAHWPPQPIDWLNCHRFRSTSSGAKNSFSFAREFALSIGIAIRYGLRHLLSRREPRCFAVVWRRACSNGRHVEHSFQHGIVRDPFAFTTVFFLTPQLLLATIAKCDLPSVRFLF
jgi:hypothetical protein